MIRNIIIALISLNSISCSDKYYYNQIGEEKLQEFKKETIKEDLKQKKNNQDYNKTVPNEKNDIVTDVTDNKSDIKDIVNSSPNTTKDINNNVVTEQTTYQAGAGVGGAITNNQPKSPRITGIKIVFEKPKPRKSN